MNETAPTEVPRFLYWLIPLIAIGSVLLLLGVSPVVIGAVVGAGWLVWALFDNGRSLRSPAAIFLAVLSTAALAGFAVIIWAVMAAIIAA